jgi:hypothetical protein
MWAQQGGRAEVVKLLRQAGANGSNEGRP